jgi:hypothetical protein
MTVKIPPQVIISLIVTVVMIIVVYAIMAPILTGQEARAFSQLGDAIDQACGEPTGVQQISIFMPDSAGNTELNTVFFYFAVDQSKSSLILARRTYGVEKNDYLVNFVDWVRGKEGNKVIRERILKTCLSKHVQVCAQFDPKKDPKCGDYQFESEEGKEALSFTLNRTRADRLVLSYTRSTVCGDGRCCPSEDKTTCPQDCLEAKPCKIFTTSET